MESLTQSKPLQKPLFPIEYNPWLAWENEGRILFIGGIPLDSNFSDVFHFLSKFDTVKWLRVETDDYERPKGYAYALLATDEGYCRILSSPCWKLRGVPVGVKIWKDPKKYLLEKDELQRRKVFIKRLSPYTTEKSIQKYFSQFGELERVDLRRNHEDNTSRRIGFVTFMTVEAAESCLALTAHLLDGSAICCRKSKNVAETKKEKSFVSGTNAMSSSFHMNSFQNHSQKLPGHHLEEQSRCSDLKRADEHESSISLTKENLHFLVSEYSINPQLNDSRTSSYLEPASQDQCRKDCLSMSLAIEARRNEKSQTQPETSPMVPLKTSELQESSHQLSAKLNKTFSSMESSSGIANRIQAVETRQVTVFFFVFPGYI